MKKISIVTPCFNEEDNIVELHERIQKVMRDLPYEYEHICIDNCSTDRTVETLRLLASEDKNLKVIINSKNFGHIRSPYYGILNATGDAVVLMASDLQDPPELIPEFVSKWENGFKTVIAVKPESDENGIVFKLRKIYYSLINKISETPLVNNATGTGLYDKSVVDTLKTLDDPYPYFRGLVCELGLNMCTVQFKQPRRTRGVTKNNFYTLYDIAMLGITNHSKVPLRIITITGFVMSLVSFSLAIIFFVAKLFFWNVFQAGFAPVLIGMFFLFSIQMLGMGIMGEYIGSIHTKVRKLPLVVEAERINF